MWKVLDHIWMTTRSQPRKPNAQNWAPTSAVSVVSLVHCAACHSAEGEEDQETRQKDQPWLGHHVRTLEIALFHWLLSMDFRRSPFGSKRGKKKGKGKDVFTKRRKELLHGLDDVGCLRLAIGREGGSKTWWRRGKKWNFSHTFFGARPPSSFTLRYSFLQRQVKRIAQTHLCQRKWEHKLTLKCISKRPQVASFPQSRASARREKFFSRHPHKTFCSYKNTSFFI